MKKRILLSLLISTLIVADELNTHTELSYSATSGNTDTDSFAFAFEGNKKLNRHNFKLNASALYSQDSGATSKNKWFLALNYDYSFDNKWELNYLIAYKKDKFSGFNYQFNTGPGLRYQWIEEDKHNLKIGANILYSIDDIELEGTNNYTSFGVGGDYEWQILDNLKFIQNLIFKDQVNDIENYFIFSKTALESKITEIFALGLSYKVDYANIPAEDKKRTDTTFLASLIIDY